MSSNPHSDRFFPEPSSEDLSSEKKFRTCFDRDRDRILHATAFRRLAHKTQVVFDTQNDHIRTRLTHSIEVSQIARSLARYFGANEALTEAIALAHDLGHAPFGHAGEEALRKASGINFHHNDHTLRIVLSLEQPYKPYGIDGLNLTKACIESIALHNGPLKSLKSKEKLPYFFKWLSEQDEHGLNLEDYGSLEAQIAAIADDVAYIAHDLDDALRLQKITLQNAIETNELLEKVWKKIQERVSVKTEDDSARILLVRSLIREMVHEIIERTEKEPCKQNITSHQDVRKYGKQIIHYNDFTPLKSYLEQHYWKSEEMTEQKQCYQNKIFFLYNAFISDCSLFEKEKSRMAFSVPYPTSREEEIAIYIAGMTDRFALRTCEDLQ